MSWGTLPTQHTEQQQNLQPRKEWLTAGGDRNRCRQYICNRTCLCSKHSKAPEETWLAAANTENIGVIQHDMTASKLLNCSTRCLNAGLAHSHQGLCILLHSGYGTLASSESTQANTVFTQPSVWRQLAVDPILLGEPISPSTAMEHRSEFMPS